MLRQRALGRALGQLLAEENQSESMELIRLAVRFNLKYRKADIAGRLHGGVFTNFASTGGRLGKLAGAKTKLPVNATNLMLSTFGATIQSVAEGLETPDHIVNAAISGKVQKLPEGYHSLAYASPNDRKVPQLTDAVSAGLHGVSAVNNIAPGPIPISEFCSRPENIKLRRLCQ